MKRETWLRSKKNGCFERLRVELFNKLRTREEAYRRLAASFERAFGTSKTCIVSRMNNDPKVDAFVAGPEESLRFRKDGSY